VKNELDPSQCVVYPGPEQPVRIRDQTYDSRF
jgi:hypothetical protein